MLGGVMKSGLTVFFTGARLLFEIIKAIIITFGIGVSPPGILFFLLNKQVLLCFGVGGVGFRRTWDSRTQNILPSLMTLIYEAERTLNLLKHGAARCTPLVVSSVSCWARSNIKRSWLESVNFSQ